MVRLRCVVFVYLFSYLEYVVHVCVCVLLLLVMCGLYVPDCVVCAVCMLCVFLCWVDVVCCSVLRM